MVETYDIRLFSKYRSLVSDAGTIPPPRPGYVTVTVCGRVGDPVFVRIGELEDQFRKSGLGFAVAGWEIQRSYTEEEIARAQLFLLKVPFTEVAAEEYGTQYQDSPECEPEVSVLEHVGGEDSRIGRTKVSCGLRSKQIGPLRIPFQELRRNLDVYRVWGGELIVSERFVNLVTGGGFSGGTFFPISDSREDALTSPLQFSDSPHGLEVLSIAAVEQMSPSDWDFWLWLNSEQQKSLLEGMLAEKRSTAEGKGGQTRNLAQLVLRSKPVEVSEQTRFGATPFDTNRTGYHHCDAGIIGGMRLITPLSVLRSSWDGSDLCRTDVWVGGQRQGLFRPHQLLLVSKKLLLALQQAGMTGFQFEVVGMA